MEVTTLYVSTGSNLSKIYHTGYCGAMKNTNTGFPATQESLALLKQLGYTVCRNCQLVWRKAQVAEEQANLLEALGITMLAVPDEFELRVYWHRGKGNPVQIWSSRGES